MAKSAKRDLNSISQQEIDRWITPPRFRAFLEAAEGDLAGATALYDWNVCVSAVFFEAISYTEVLLRNAIDAQFPPVRHEELARESWICDPGILTPKSLERVVDAIANIERMKKQPTRARVIANLSFGFWRAMLDRHYKQLWIISANIAKRHDELIELTALVDRSAARWVEARSSVPEVIAWRPPLTGHRRTLGRLGLTPRTVRFHVHR